MVISEAYLGAKGGSHLEDFADKDSSSNEILQGKSISRGQIRTRSKRSDSNAGLPYFGTDNLRQMDSGLGKEMVNSSLLPSSHERADLALGRMMSFNPNTLDSDGIQNPAVEV